MYTILQIQKLTTLCFERNPIDVDGMNNLVSALQMNQVYI